MALEINNWVGIGQGRLVSLKKANNITRDAFLLPLFSIVLSLSAPAQPGYTNHAGNVVAGWPVRLTAKEVALGEGVVSNDRSSSTNGCNQSTFQHFNFSTTNTYPLSIFPEPEQRRIAADFVLRQGAAGHVDMLRIPVAVKRAVAGADKAMARSRKRSEKGFCTKEESDAFCAKSAAALKSYLDRQVESGTITPAERRALGR